MRVLHSLIIRCYKTLSFLLVDGAEKPCKNATYFFFININTFIESVNLIAFSAQNIPTERHFRPTEIFTLCMDQTRNALSHIPTETTELANYKKETLKKLQYLSNCCIRHLINRLKK